MIISVDWEHCQIRSTGRINTKPVAAGNCVKTTGNCVETTENLANSKTATSERRRLASRKFRVDSSRIPVVAFLTGAFPSSSLL